MSTAPTLSLPHKPHIKAGLTPRTVSVESQTKAGIFYSVNVALRRCSCPAGKRGRLCWHLSTALAYDAWRRAQQSSVIPITASVAPAPFLARPAGMAALQECFG